MPQMILEVNQRCTFEIIEDRGKLLIKHAYQTLMVKCNLMNTFH